MNWTLDIKEDPDTGDAILEFPEDLIKQTGWKEGDVLDWSDNGDGSWTLTKKAITNEKFEDLMYHAGLTAQGCWDEMDDYDRTAIKKFAELIVKEMLQTCEDHPAWTGRMIGEQIKQHFGVEK
jgi:hypothetical protein